MRLPAPYGRFELVRWIGGGGESDVWQARSGELPDDHLLAIKFAVDAKVFALAMACDNLICLGDEAGRVLFFRLEK